MVCNCDSLENCDRCGPVSLAALLLGLSVIQWAGEVISSRDKSTVTDEFRELETDVALRKEGLLRCVHISKSLLSLVMGNLLFHRLQFSSEAYHHAVTKKKEFAALEQNKEKLLPIDALGIVMRNHGEEFGEDSAFGGLLVSGWFNYFTISAQQGYRL
jgi:hypothetical protein